MSELAIHFFDKMKIMVVKDIEREDIEFITKVQLKNSWLIKYVLILCWILDIELPTHRQSGSFLARIYGNCWSSWICPHRYLQSREGNW